jgi:HD-like signal output (HDOD) protein
MSEHPPKIATLIDGIPRSLGSYAPVLDEIQAALDSPQSSVTTVAEAIEKDPNLTASLLRLSNSSFYGFSTRLTTVNEAISLIGIQQVQDLIMASSIVDRFAGLPVEFVDMRSFWRHSLACGIGARALALEGRIPRADRFFVAGLLHDAGRLVLFSQVPEFVRSIFELSRRENVLLVEAEMRVLGYDHTDVGEALLRHWNFPLNLMQAVAYHHDPADCKAAADEAAVVHVSDHLVNAMQLGSSGERPAPPLHGSAWKRLNLPLEMISSVVDTIDEQMDAVESAFLSTAQGHPQ